MVAAVSPDRKFLTLAVVNATDAEQRFDLSVSGAHLSGPLTLWRMTGTGLEAANRAGEPPQVAVQEMPISTSSGTIRVAPISIDVYRFPVALPQ